MARSRGGVETPTRRGVVDVGGPAAEPFRMLRLGLELRPETRRGNILLVTSATVGAGKSTIAGNYALVAALNQQRVLLIDADLRHPVLHEMFGARREPGIVDVLGRQAKLESCVQRLGLVGEVDLLAAGTNIGRVGDLMASNAMGDLLEQVSEGYGTIIVDSPPVLEAPDASALASRPGVDVLLVADGKGRRRPIVKALHALELIDANVLGLLVNREGKLSKYGYGAGSA